jgi:hypothetical protein
LRGKKNATFRGLAQRPNVIFFGRIRMALGYRGGGSFMPGI